MASRIPGVLAAAIVAGVAVFYLVIIFGEPEPNDGTVVAFVAGALALGAALSIAGSLAHDPWWRRVLFGFAAAIVLLIAWLGAFSIGLLLVPAVLLLMFALGRG
jgi:hypothetical protein